jgi:hypothetical protein
MTIEVLSQLALVAPLEVPSRSTLHQYARELEVLRTDLELVRKATESDPLHADGASERALWQQCTALELKIQDGWAARTPNFSTDIVQCIVDNYIDGVFQRVDVPGRIPRRFLAGLCLISRTWLYPGRRALYHDLCFILIGHEKLVRAIREFPIIRPYIRRVRVTPESLAEENWLSVLPADCVLHFYAYLQHSKLCLRKVWPILLDQNPKQLKQIEIWGESADDEPSRRETREVDWKHVESLSLNLYNFALIMFPFHHFLNVSFPKLASLHLFACNYVSFPACHGTLHALMIRECCNVHTSPFLALIRHNAATLEKITIINAEFNNPISCVLEPIAAAA